MEKQRAILIFDVGKTNKKLLLFNEQYQLVLEESLHFNEIPDEEGFMGEDLQALTAWLKSSYEIILSQQEYEIVAVNFSAYGASFVYLDETYQVVTPLYNYLKPYPQELQQKFYSEYGGETKLAKQTASPVLGSLNSGMQLYRIKYEKPELFGRIRYALHLPQYLSFVIGGKTFTDLTSVGCHTNLWNFWAGQYHEWVSKEGVLEKFPPLLPCDEVATVLENGVKIGAGLHDSSAALIPYLATFKEPFILLSTGTWCISLHPFNYTQLTDHELSQDCLCYLSYFGKPVKASRLFAGYEHEQQTKRLAEHFGVEPDYFTRVKANDAIIKKLQLGNDRNREQSNTAMVGRSVFSERSLAAFDHYEEAYHQLIADLVTQQVRSTNLVLNTAPVKRIFVDGGFSKNPIYMQLLAMSYPDLEIYAASVAQATALGAAMALHQHWNAQEQPPHCVELKLFR
jgi:sugar (pentulose or hexulose) kinase